MFGPLGKRKNLLNFLLVKNSVEAGTTPFTFIFFRFLIAIIAIITYEIISIIYLIKYYTLANNCEGSYLWEYIFISLMISLLAIAANY